MRLVGLPLKPEQSGNRPLASVIIVTHNGGNTIAECLDSIKKLHWQQMEVVLVDNSSTDDTLDKVQRILPTARIIRLSKNLGYGGGCNAGAGVARSPILVFLNQDVRLTPAFLDTIMNRMANDPRVGVCGGIILSWDGSRLVSAGQFFERWTGYALDYGFGSTNVSLGKNTDEVFSPNGAAFAVRREVFDLIEGFSDYFFLYFDETDLAWRARLAGFRTACCPTAVAFHKIDPRRAHSAWSRYYTERNSLLSAVTNYETSTLLFALPISLVLRLAGVLVLTLFRRTKHARSTARALIDFLALLPTAQERRSKVRALRKLKDREILTTNVLASPKDILRIFQSSLLPSTSERGGP